MMALQTLCLWDLGGALPSCLSLGPQAQPAEECQGQTRETQRPPCTLRPSLNSGGWIPLLLPFCSWLMMLNSGVAEILTHKPTQMISPNINILPFETL